MTKGKLSILAGVLVVSAITASAGSAGAAEKVELQALLNDDGSGSLFVGDINNNWTWHACTPDLANCTLFATGREITTTGAQRNTVFKVSGSAGTGLSPVWQGNTTPISPPSVAGEIRVNERVAPIPATWQGGWEGDFDLTQLAACETAAGHRCISLTDPKYVDGCKGGATVLAPELEGYYLRVADRRYGVGTIFTLEGAGSPYGHEIWQAQATTSVAVVGRIKRATSPRKRVKCAPPMSYASISENGIASIGCVLDCRAVLIASRNGRRARVERSFHGVPGRKGPIGSRPLRLSPLRLSPDALDRLGAGPAHVRVTINGRRVAQRLVRFN